MWSTEQHMYVCVCVCLLSHVWLFVTLWAVAPPSSSVHGILQARILEWVAISFSSGSFWLRDGTCISCIFCIVRRILHLCTTWEVPWGNICLLYVYCLEPHGWGVREAISPGRHCICLHRGDGTFLFAQTCLLLIKSCTYRAVHLRGVCAFLIGLLRAGSLF